MSSPTCSSSRRRSLSSSPLRQLRAEDAEEVAELYARAWPDARVVDAEEIRSWLRNEEFEPGWLRVLEVDGRVAGYGDIWPRPDVLEVDASAPGHWHVFFEWAEREARERGIPRVRTHFVYGHPLEELLAARGYTRWRSSFHLEIDLDDPPLPELPAGLRVRGYDGAGDDEPLRAALNESFADDAFWDEVTPTTFRAFFLGSRGFDPSLWALAWDGGELAGCSLAYTERGGDTTLGWIGTLGVRPAWRRRGLGEALLRRSFHDLHARGLRRAGLGVDAENATGAVRLYERAGMRQVLRQDNWVKDL